MAKKVKVNKREKYFQELPSNEGLKRLKVNDQVVCMTPYSVEITTVEEVDKKKGLATLANKVQCSTGIQPNGDLTKVGITHKDQRIMILNDESQVLHDAFFARLGLRRFQNNLKGLLEDTKHPLEGLEVIELERKLSKVLGKVLEARK